MVRSQSSGRMSSTLAVGPAMPALFTSTSRPCKCFSTSLNRRSTSSSFATSATVCVTAGSCFFVLARAFSSMSQICTRAPCSTNVRVITRPMPAAPAVTRTRSPLAENSIAPHNTLTFTGEGVAEKERRRTTISIEQEELRGISRTVAEIHRLLLILVLLYLVFGGERGDPEADAAVSAGLFFYAALVMSFRYANFYKGETRWKIAIEAAGMIVFITWVLWFTERLAGPLVNLYFLPVITSALTLGKVATLGNVGLIAACYVLLGSSIVGEMLTLRFAAGFAAQLSPVLLVAYITTMFSADIRYGLQQAKLLSETDELTGLFNTRGFAIAANRLFSQATRYGRPASVLMIDSDNLKQVNDTHGHEAGSRLLRQVANAVQAELRSSDVPARYGGDEFIVLLPETPPKGALDVAERIRNAIASRPLAVNGQHISATVSVGIACYPEDGKTLDALAARADRALYLAKQEGRNRVIRFKTGSEVGEPSLIATKRAQRG